MKTITSSVAFQGPDGTIAANGRLLLSLSQNAMITSGGGQVYSLVPVVIDLDANGLIPAGTTIWANDELTPSGTTYLVNLQDRNRGRLDTLGTWSISGASPIDLSGMTPSSAAPSFPFPVLLAPVGNQTVVQPSGTNLFVNRFENIRFADQFAGTTWELKVAAAITDLAGPGVVDASAFTSTQSFSGNLTIAQAGVKIIFPPVQINQGTNQILITAGTTGVSFVGTVSYGTASGTVLAYTGTSAGIDVGDSSADTSDFYMENIRFDVATANSAAIGLRLNRCINYRLEYLTGVGLASANTQKLIDLEGFTNFTGGTIIGFSSINGESSIFFGKNANANSLFYLQLNPTATSGFGLNFDGGGVGCGGNQVFGGDAEGGAAGIRFDYASDNYVVMRLEANTNSVVATANSATNFTYTTGQELAAATNAGTGNAIGGPKGFNVRLMGTTGNSGFSWLSGTITNLIAGGANQWLYTAGLSRMGSAHIVSMSSNADPNVASGDINFTRQAAGIFQVGTGETANANGKVAGADWIGPVGATTPNTGSFTTLTGSGAVTLSGSGSSNAHASINRLKANRGTALVSGDFALSAGWGSTAALSAIAGTDTGFTVTVTANGAGIAANPTLTLTYKDGTWTNAPVFTVTRGDGNAPTTGFWIVQAASTATAAIAQFVGLPVAGNTYTIYVIVVGH